MPLIHQDYTCRRQLTVKRLTNSPARSNVKASAASLFKRHPAIHVNTVERTPLWHFVKGMN
jgi:hypothetical protein